MSLHQPQAPTLLQASIAETEAFKASGQPYSEAPTYAAYAGDGLSMAPLHLQGILRGVRAIEGHMLTHWRNRRAARSKLDELPASAVSHADAVLAHYDKLAPIMAELRARRDAVAAPMKAAA